MPTSCTEARLDVQQRRQRVDAVRARHAGAVMRQLLTRERAWDFLQGRQVALQRTIAQELSAHAPALQVLIGVEGLRVDQLHVHTVPGALGCAGAMQSLFTLLVYSVRQHAMPETQYCAGTSDVAQIVTWESRSL